MLGSSKDLPNTFLDKYINSVFFKSNKAIDKKFDIIFIDPPYKEIEINELLEKIIENKILKDNGVIILHRHKKDKLEITKKIKIFDTRQYGVSKVYIAG